jgi:hypothetical protein
MRMAGYKEFVNNVDILDFKNHVNYNSLASDKIWLDKMGFRFATGCYDKFF